MKTKLYFFAILILSSKLFFAQSLTETFNLSQNDLTFTQTNGYDLINHPQLNNLSGNELAGKPQLPVKYFKLLLPKGAKVTSVSMEVIEEVQLSGNYYLNPIQPPHYANGKEQPAFIEPDPSIYNSNTPYPTDNIANFQTQVFRDYFYTTIGFIPFNYIPKDKILHFYKNIDITVNYTINPLAKSHRVRDYSKIDNTIYNFMEQTMLNGDRIQDTNYYEEADTKISQFQTKNTSTIIGKAFTPT